ncbi:MetQ/NlpA family ABC transporter substrate-binding protein [Tistrella mobilis]|uniref:MetQ/NlpA family ABC transporter substrate-binding protein n=1 Tax=Tistrella mobilis TaxID=171437 RepID=UPI003557F460
MFRSFAQPRPRRKTALEEGRRRLFTAILGLAALVAAFAAGGLAARAAGTETVRLGVIAGAEEEIAEVVKQVAARDGLNVEIVTFQDYVLPNEALAAGDLDANAFQHQPYLDAQITAHGYDIVNVGYTIVEPIGIYSTRVKRLADLAEGAKLGIPNDPSNGGRVLNLLAREGMIELAPGKGLTPTLLDITANPKKLEIVELDAAQLPRAVPDLDAAAINGNYAHDAGFDPTKDAIAIESRTDNPYGNFVAARAADAQAPRIRKLVAAYQSDEVKAFLAERFKGAILPAW